jgi:virginiamycin B lyase
MGRRAAAVAIVGSVAVGGMGPSPALGNPPTESWPVVSTSLEEPSDLTLGPDGNIWVAYETDCRIGKVSPSGQVASYAAVAREGSGCALGPSAITAGPDGAVWFTNVEPPRVGRVTTAGSITWFGLPEGVAPLDTAGSITHGPDGALWFAAFDHRSGSHALARMAADGGLTTVPVLQGRSGSLRAVTSTASAVWWSFAGSPSAVGRTVPGGGTTTFDLPSTAAPRSLAAAPNGDVWVARDDGRLSRFTSDGQRSDVQALGTPLDIAIGPDAEVWYSFEERVAKAMYVDPGAGRGVQQVTATGQAVRTARWAWTGVLADVTPTPRLLAPGSDGRLWFGADYGSVGSVSLDKPFPMVTLDARVDRQERGAQVTFSVTVSATAGASAIPTGQVEIYQYMEARSTSLTRLGTATLGPGGRATITATVPWGFYEPDLWKARYLGDSAFAGSASPPMVADFRQSATTDVFIRQVYSDLLGRLPEPAAVEYWTGRLTAGSPRTAVAHAIVISTEHRQRLVDGWFQTYLGRRADPAGREHFLTALRSGATFNQARASILGSDEHYRRAGGTVDGFLDALYRGALGRAPDDGGRQHWHAQLGRGVSRATVASAVLHSREGSHQLVRNHFDRFLRRDFVDGPALEHWGGLLQRGFREERLIAEIVGSDEYFHHASTGRF